MRYDILLVKLTYVKKEIDMNGAESPLFVGALAKGLKVLAAFGTTHRSMSLPEIAAATGMGKSSAQRAAFTLETLGFLCRQGSGKRFILTPRVLDLGFRYLQANSLVERANPYLHEGARQCEETVNLAELDGTDVVLVARFQGRHLATARMLVGTRVPVFCTAAGRAMLSALPDARVADILDASDLRAFTPHTVTARHEILERVGEARRDGFACVEQEYFRGDISIGSPVRGPDGAVVGAVTVYAPMTGWTAAAARDKLAPVVVEIAWAISSAENDRDAAGL